MSVAWFWSLGVWSLALGLSLVLGKWVQSLGIEDAPDGIRKHQDRPISRLGGVAILLSILPIYVGLGLTQAVVLPQAISLALGFSSLAYLLGLWDDIWHANTKLKLLLLSLLCVLVTSFGLVAEILNTPWGALEHPLLLIIGSALWLLVFTNSANFLDGSNGLSVGCLLIMLAGLALVSRETLNAEIALWWWPLFGALVGFLVHNLNGTLYVGDAGALGLGALFASLGLALQIEVWTLATLALPFLVDVLMTLIWRARKGRNWLAAHLDHAYQNLRLAGWSHFETALLYWGFTLTCAVVAWIASRAGGAAPFLTFSTLALVGCLLWHRHRRAQLP